MWDSQNAQMCKGYFRSAKYILCGNAKDLVAILNQQGPRIIKHSYFCFSVNIQEDQ